MNRIRNSFLPALLAALLFSVPAAADPVRVVTSVTDLAWIVKQVGGNHVEVQSLCKGYQDPHYLEPKPSNARDLKKADLLVVIGLELEVGWLPRLLETARNPDLAPGSPHILEASSAVSRILETPRQIDRSQGDVHPFGNPHYLLDPRNIGPIGEAVAASLARLDPGNASAYTEGAADLREQMNAHIAGWTARAEPLRGAPVVAFHKQWEYLADWLDLEVLGYIENRPGIPSSPRHIDDLIETMLSHRARLVLAAIFVDVHAAEEVARRGQARLAVLPPSAGAVEGTDTYPLLIDVILTHLLGGGS